MMSMRCGSSGVASALISSRRGAAAAAAASPLRSACRGATRSLVTARHLLTAASTSSTFPSSSSSPVSTMAEKPSETTVYMKAGPDGKSRGDCPFAHSVVFGLNLKNVEFNTVPCVQDTKPQWLLDEVQGKMPCVLYNKEPHVETMDILEWMEGQFAEPPLAAPQGTPDEVKSGFGLMPAIAQFTKNTDESKDEELKQKLLDALSKLNEHLKATPGGFLCGDQPTIPDVALLPKLFMMEIVTPHFKNFGLKDVPDNGPLMEYYEKGTGLPAFQAGVYEKEFSIKGWAEKRAS